MSSVFVPTSRGRVRITDVGEGPPIILLHGNGGSQRTFESVMPMLASEHRVVAWDMVGQGDSDPLTSHMGVADHASVLQDVLDRLEIERPTVCGTSIGAFIAAHLAATVPDRVSGVVLVELNHRSATWWSEHWELVEAKFCIPDQDDLSLQADFVRQLGQDELTVVKRDRWKAGTTGMMDVMWAIREYDLSSTLLEVAVPTLVVMGHEGPAIGAADQIRADIPHSAYVGLASSGHYPMVDVPGDFAAALREFCLSVPE